MSTIHKANPVDFLSLALKKKGIVRGSVVQISQEKLSQQPQKNELQLWDWDLEREAEWFRRSRLCVLEGKQKQKLILSNGKSLGAFCQGVSSAGLVC